MAKTYRSYVPEQDLPHFNPDLDVEGMAPAEPVRDLRKRVAAADGLLICSPEYAHGVAGSMKNALDWLVSDAEMAGKPVGLLSASSRSVHAPAALAETLRTMSTAVVPDASIVVPLDGRRRHHSAARSSASPRCRIRTRHVRMV